MFLTFFTNLREAKVPVTLREYLTLMEGLDKDVADFSVDGFYHLARVCLVKDERNLDKFDRVFSHVFKGLELMEEALTAEIPEEWLKKLTEKYLTEEEKKQIEAMGGLDKLMETLRQRLKYRLLASWLLPPLHFLSSYVLLGGFLDGRAGLSFALSKMFYFYMVQFKIRELLSYRDKGT